MRKIEHKQARYINKIKQAKRDFEEQLRKKKKKVAKPFF